MIGLIDEKKYEGHTPAPWVLKSNYASHSVKDANGNHVCTIQTDEVSNKNLITDSPLLLAEVLRLRDENALLASQIRLAYEWVEAFHNEGTMISFIEHVYGDEEE